MSSSTLLPDVEPNKYSLSKYPDAGSVGEKVSLNALKFELTLYGVL